MDKAKLRIMAGAGGALLGFAGVLFLSFSLAALVAHFFGWVIGALAVGIMLVICSLLGISYFLAPLKTAEEEIEQLEEATAEALAELPFDTVKALVDKRPLMSVSVAALIGYSVANDPKNAASHAQRLAFGLF